MDLRRAMPILNKYGVKGGGGVGKNTRCEGGISKEIIQSSFAGTASVLMQQKPARMPKPAFRTFRKFRLSLGSVPSDHLLHYVPIISIFVGYKAGGTQKILSN